MRKTFISTLIDLANRHPEIYLLTPDIGYSVVEQFQQIFPKRFLNTGITEQATIGVAAGLALSGYIPFVYTIIPFVTMRCFEQVRLDVAYQNLPIRLVGVGAGYSYGPAGATHHAIEDIAIMRALPNMTVICPGDPLETKILMEQSMSILGPIYFRLGKNGEPVIHSSASNLKIGKGSVLKEGLEGVIITTSNMLEQGKNWIDNFSNQGIDIGLVSMHTVKPLDILLIKRLIDLNIPMLVLEEHSLIGGLGSAIAEVIADYGKGICFKRIAISDQFTHCIGSQKFIKQKMGLLDIESAFHFFTSGLINV